MFKYFTILICLPFASFAQDQAKVYYATPYLQIEKVNEKPLNDLVDFGYNILIHPNNTFIKEGYYMWVDDQWYQLLNANEIFTLHPGFETLFTINKSQKDLLKIKDVNNVIYLYPIEALDGYKVSFNDYNTLSKIIQKPSIITFKENNISPNNQTSLEDFVLDVEEVGEVAVAETNNVNTDEENVAINEIADENVVITSKNPTSVLLDVIDVVEIVKNDETLLDQLESNDQLVDKVIDQEAHQVEHDQLKISATNTLIIAKPANDYEVAVNEGFDGTVTEWIEMVNAQGGKTAYEQAVEKGFIGTEEEWMSMLWGREVDVEIAKRDKTTAIVMEWIQSLNTSNGNAPYERALKHGFYGTFTEWVESVIGTDGEKAYEHAKTKGFEGTYKEWIEDQLNKSNKELLRKERLAQTQMFVAPNVMLPLTAETAEPLTFDLYDYYNQFYGSAMITSAGQSNNNFDIKPTDLEYQITWFEKDKIKILELSKKGILKYVPLETNDSINTSINIRYILK